jgi:hypothetical protein
MKEKTISRDKEAKHPSSMVEIKNMILEMEQLEHISTRDLEQLEHMLEATETRVDAFMAQLKEAMDK